MGTSKFHSFRPACVLQVSGPDATSFLQGQFSNDLGTGKRGGRVYGLWLDRKGKALADSFVLARGEDVYLAVSYYSSEAVIQQRLDDYLVMDEVDLEGVTSRFKGWSVFGGVQEALCEMLGTSAPESGSFRQIDGVAVFWGRRGAEESLEILLDEGSASAASWAERVQRVLDESDCREIGEDELLRISIEGRVPRIGREFGPTDLPQEIGLVDTAVSFSKGCYLGQEVMARLRSLGRVRKRLERVEVLGTVHSDQMPLELKDESGKRQGELRSVAYSDDGCIGLAIISTSFAGGELRAGEARVKLEGDKGSVRGDG